MVLNALWLLVTQQGWIWLSVLVDGTFGAYLGWVSVATCANVTAALVDSGVDLGPGANEVVAAAVVVMALGVGVLLTWRLGGRWAVAAALAWGLAWIAIGRLTDEPRSVLTGVTAAFAAAGVLAAAAWFGRRGRGRPPQSVAASPSTRSAPA